MSLSEETKRIQSLLRDPGEVRSDLYLRLIDCIVDHNHLYYVENKPIISDKEYDELFDYLKKIEEHFPQIITSNSPTQSLLGQVSDGFQKANHKVKLASLENTYNSQDIMEWDERICKLVGQDYPNVKYRVEPKFDGLGVELVYEKGIFVKAITRGDGLVGDDITENVKMIKNIPKKLNVPLDICVRGEIVMPKSVWEDLNKERELLGETPFANTRNAAAGSIKLLDSKEAGRRGLLCYVYDVLRAGLLHPSLDGLGLPVFDRVKIGQTIDDVKTLCEDVEVKKFLENQDIDFDGLVIKVESQSLREIIGSTDHHPRWAVAYKFPAQMLATQVNSVDFQVGRTGIITPVANLEPVELSGVTIKRVSLHNFDFIKLKDIHIHDRIWLQRSGEVIPYIVSTITDRRPVDAVSISMPVVCPSCGGKIEHEDIRYYCRNSHCTAQLKQRIIHFVSKNCMDIEGIGDSTVDILVEQGLLKDVSDIYMLSAPDIQFQILKIQGFAEKKISEIVKQIEESKRKPLWRLINGLGISGVGKKTAIDITKAIKTEHGTLNELTAIITNEEFLRGIYGVGEKIVEGIVYFFRHNNDLLTCLEKYGLNFDPCKYVDDVLDLDSAKGTFSITGTFPISREIIIQEMQRNGYLFHDSPVKITDFVLVGDSPGSKKSKAEKLGLRIYEGWDDVVKQFPLLRQDKSFLKDSCNEVVKSQVQSLSLF